jgi:hypothetical protein
MTFAILDEQHNHPQYLYLKSEDYFAHHTGQCED